MKTQESFSSSDVTILLSCRCVCVLWGGGRLYPILSVGGTPILSGGYPYPVGDPYPVWGYIPLILFRGTPPPEGPRNQRLGYPQKGPGTRDWGVSLPWKGPGIKDWGTPRGTDRNLWKHSLTLSSFGKDHTSSLHVRGGGSFFCMLGRKVNFFCMLGRKVFLLFFCNWGRRFNQSRPFRILYRLVR